MDPDQLLPSFSDFVKRIKYRYKLLYWREKIRGISKILIVEQTDKNIILDLYLDYTSREKIPETRKFKVILYVNVDKHDQLKTDKEHLREIIELDIYPIRKYLVESSPKNLGYPVLILEDIPNEDMIRNLRITLGLKNSRAVGKRLNKYLTKRKWFHRKGQLLVNPDQKFQRVIENYELALGLNNAVYTFRIEYLSAENQTETMDFILRVYPRNENLIKAQNEAQNLKKIQELDIPKAKFYLYEEETSHIGYRFLILEKLKGKPVLETIHTFTPEQTRRFLADLAKILGKLHNIRTKKFQSYYLDVKSTRKMTFATYIYSEVSQVLKSFREMKMDQEYKADTKYLFKWFRGHKPLLNLPGYSFIHGDLRPSNIITNGHIISGLIDWEMSCYSDPAQDLGWTLFFFKLYKNLEKERGYFFEQYWKYCEKYDFEARVFFYEFIAAMKLFIYARANKRDNIEKYENNANFFSRVEKTFPQYLETVTYRINDGENVFSEDVFNEDTQKELEFKVKNLLMDAFSNDIDIFNETTKEKIDSVAREIIDLINECV